MKRKLLALLLMGASMSAMADITITQSFPGGLTNYQVYKSTDQLPTPTNLPGAWSAPASGQTQPQPQTGFNAGIYQQYTLSFKPTSIQYSSFSAARQAGIDDEVNSTGIVNGAHNWSTCTWSAGTDNGLPSAIESGGYAVDGDICNIWFQVKPQLFWCPTGYSISGPFPNYTCSLNNTVASVPKPSDGICNVIQNVNTDLWSYDNGGGVNGGDPDCTAAWQDAVAAVNDKTRGDACSCDSATPSTPSIPEPDSH